MSKENVRKFKLFPRTLSECVRPLTAPVLKKHGVEARLLTGWEQIVGRELARITSPGKLKFPAKERSGGMLTLHVVSAHLLEVQYAIPLLLEKLAVFYGYRAISRIQLQQMPPEELAVKPPPPPPSEIAEGLARLARELEENTPLQTGQ